MNLSWLESLIYGLISGITEILPVSSAAHQQIMLHLFGADGRDPVRDFFVHAGMLIAVIAVCRSFMDIVKRETESGRGNNHNVLRNRRVSHDWQLIRSALFPMIIGMLLLRYILKLQSNLLLTALFLTVNGVILFVPDRMMQGNKTARSMSALDSLLIGASGSLSVFCGVSRVACTYGTSIIRGASKKHALLWTLVLSIYALIYLCITDLVAAFTVDGINFWASFITYILSGVASYSGSYIGIRMMRFMAGRPSRGGFAYYCWGASLFSFILYLTVA